MTMKYRANALRVVSLFCTVGLLLSMFAGCQASSRRTANKITVHLAMTREIDSVSSTFRNAIEAFNEENDTYTVTLVYYKDEASLQRAVISVDAIDLIDLFGLSTDIYVAKGVLLDLYQLLDSDPELSRTDFVPSFLEMAEQNEQLPYLSASFAARSLLTPKSVVGDITGWNEEEFIQIATAAPDEYYIMEETGPLDFLSIYLTYSIQNYVDVNAGTTNLRHGALCDMLTYCKDGFRTSSQGDIPLLQYISTIFGPTQYVTFLRNL